MAYSARDSDHLQPYQPGTVGEATTLVTWCRACGGRIAVPRHGRRPDFCRLLCRIRYRWHAAHWRL